MTISTQVTLLRHKRTRIVATLGPASSDPEGVAELIRSGAGTFWLNVSHGTHADHDQDRGDARFAARLGVE